MEVRRGISLVEMVGVAVILGMIAATSTFFYNRIYTSGLAKAAEQRLAVIAQQIQMYRIDHGNIPNDLEQLLTTTGNITDGFRYRTYLQEMPLDPFMEKESIPLTQKYFKWDSNRKILWSVGPDKRSGTSDDICFSVDTFRRVNCQ